MDSNVQKNIDDKKWYESEKQKRDLCGTYDFCKYCDKKITNPCAHAVEAIQAALKETAYRRK